MEKIEVSFSKGVKSKPCRKVFKDQKSFDKWFEKNEGNVSNVQFRRVEV